MADTGTCEVEEKVTPINFEPSNGTQQEVFGKHRIFVKVIFCRT
jgi:hypothetical protein